MTESHESPRPERRGAGAVRTLGLTHLVLGVEDPERSFSFYERLLGARILYRDEAKIEFGTPGCSDVVVLERGRSGDGGGIGHFGFRLAAPENPDEVAAAVRHAGGSVEESGYFVEGAPYVFARDLDGYLVELWYEPEGDR